MEENKTTNPNELGKLICMIDDCHNMEKCRCKVKTAQGPKNEFNDQECDLFVSHSKLLAEQETEAKKHRFCNLTLSHDELETILTLLEPSSGDEDEPGYDLYMHIRRRMDNPIANAMYFINFYTIDQQYGGPEEGGWWYHTYCCNWSLGFDCCVGWQDGKPVKDFNRIVDELFSAIDEADYPGLTKEEIIEFLKTNNHYQYYKTDKYGEGWMIEITQACAGGHCTERQRYE